MSTSRPQVAAGNLGFPRIGSARELKFALEKFWSGAIPADELQRTALELRQRHWRLQAGAGLDFIPSNDFSLYDHVLDAAALVGAVPPRFHFDGGEVDLATYFAMARGTAAAHAMEMTKWFDTNYHYIVPELDAAQPLHLASNKPRREYEEARAIGVETRPVLLGPVSLVLLSRTTGSRATLVQRVADLYRELLLKLARDGVQWVQLDEPCLGLDLAYDERRLFAPAYERLSGGPKLFVATWFSDLREHLPLALGLPIDALHLDLVRAPGQLRRALDLAPPHMTLSLGVVDGRGVWRTNLDRAIAPVRGAVERLGAERVQVAPSCSLLHVPVDSDLETGLDPALRGRLAFATQKLGEVALIARAASDDELQMRARLSDYRRTMKVSDAHPRANVDEVRRRTASVTDDQLQRAPAHSERKRAQEARSPLPVLPTTTIGSLPQTAEGRRMRAAARRGRVSSAEYDDYLKHVIERGIRFQEALGIDVLVHGEFERGDMVEYFAERLEGFAFTEHGWVQSYGSRYVKPPLLYGDVSRPRPMTVEWSRYAQSLTSRPVKGMLTGPVTMMQWSFVRDDLAPASIAMQIALALRDEIADLEQAGLHVIQVDEPALREGLPLHHDERDDYLRWSVDAFRLATAAAGSETQVHTHMCYADFGEIMDAVARMDADVISLEAARSGMELLQAFEKQRYANDIGPGVYDIHSPRVPPVEEIVAAIQRALQTFTPEQLWVNPDCGLKTRSWEETRLALANMVEATTVVRDMVAGGTVDLVSEPSLAAANGSTA